MITVVIPLYNKAHTIKDTLNTVLNQTYSEYEIIIVNDGSTDNGVQIIKDNFNDKRIRIINQKDFGVSVARNRGIKEAKYNYIALLDADDNWHPDYLSIMQDAINKYPNSSLICSGGLIKNANGSIVYRLANKYINQILPVNFFENPFLFCHTSGTIINKKYFDKTEGFPPGMLCLEDFALFMQLALIGKFIYVGIPISKYIGGVEGQITSVTAEKKFKLLKYVCFFYNFIQTKRNNNVDNIFNIYLKYDIRNRIKNFMKEQDLRGLDYFIDNLSVENLSLFSKLEIILYKKRYIALSILWIKFTKCIWRMHRFPIIGEKINSKKINPKYRIW